MAKATVDKLGDVHGKIADWCIAKLDEEEPVMTMTEMGPVPTGVTKKTATASDITAMVNFLAKNNISADLNANKGLGEVHEKLKNRTKHSERRSKADLPLPNNLTELKVARNE